MFDTFNFATGRGTSVLELVAALEKASGKKVPVVFGPRRVGDLAECYCKLDKAVSVLGWKPEYGIEEMCADAWRWQIANPEGFVSTK